MPKEQSPKKGYGIRSWTAVLTALCLLLLPCASSGQAVGACEHGRPIQLDAEADSVLRIAAAVAGAEHALSNIWPDYWPVGQPFILTVPERLIVLVSHGQPDAPFERACLPEHFRSIEGRVYVHRGTLDGLYASVGFFDLAYTTGDVVAPAVPVRGGIAATAEFLLHEAFHAYQEARFPPPQRNESAAGPYGDTAFNRLAELERRTLAEALLLTDPDSLVPHLHEYLAVRERRLASASAIFRRTEAEIETIEGSAQFVGSAGKRVVVPGEAATLVDDAVAMLREAPPIVGRWTNERERLRRAHRGRLYGTGLALALLLDRLGTDWRAELEAGRMLVDLLGPAVGYRRRTFVPPQPKTEW